MIKVFSHAERKQLSLDGYSKHVSRVIRELLQKHNNGLTIGNIKRETGFNKSTIEKHLLELVAINFAYRKKIGTAYVYYPNGRTMHSIIERDIEIGDKLYSFFRLGNDDEQNYIYIQEKTRDSINALKPSGGILVKETDLTDLIQVLNKISKQVKKNAKS